MNDDDLVVCERCGVEVFAVDYDLIVFDPYAPILCDDCRDVDGA
jgi:hypothetical protein